MSVMIWWKRAPMALPNSLSTVSVSIINVVLFSFFPNWDLRTSFQRGECQTTCTFVGHISLPIHSSSLHLVSKLRQQLFLFPPFLGWQRGAPNREIYGQLNCKSPRVVSKTVRAITHSASNTHKKPKGDTFLSPLHTRNNHTASLMKTTTEFFFPTSSTHTTRNLSFVYPQLKRSFSFGR
jgi:hypothetical protein